MSHFGDALKAARGFRSLSSVAKEMGISVAYLSDIEKGRRGGRMLKIARFAEVLGVEDKVLHAAAALDDGYWVVRAWDGMPWQAREFLADLARDVRPPGDFWQRVGERMGYKR